MVKVNKETDAGIQVLAVNTPCVVTFTKPSWELRYPTIRRIIAANRTDIPTLSELSFPDMDKTRIGLKGSPTRVKKTFVPQKKSGGVMIREHSGAESAKKLLQLLGEANVI